MALTKGEIREIVQQATRIAYNGVSDEEDSRVWATPRGYVPNPPPEVIGPIAAAIVAATLKGTLGVEIMRALLEEK